MTEEGWNGDGYYLNLQGKYNAKGNKEK